MTIETLISRTCTEVATDHLVRADFEGPQPLSAFREVPSYVLLGEPGAGKTTEFGRECKALGDQAALVSARKFAKADIADNPVWRGKVLFIDGLDETRAAGRDATETLDEIVAKLERLDRPRFRISCRAADWFGPVDRHPLTELSPDGRVIALQLDPLDRRYVHDYLSGQLKGGDPTDFMFEADSRGLGSLLDNPLTLELLIDTTKTQGWPDTRCEAFKGYCSKLAQELIKTHPRSVNTSPPEWTLAVVGRLFAIQLLTGAEGYTLAPTAKSTDFIPINEVTADIAEALSCTDLDIRDVFATSLFVPLDEQCHAPKHRQFAEYLAATHIAHLVETGTVSVGRVLAAMSSSVDDRIITDLRGLAAWLGTLSKQARRELIVRDPVAMGLYGDISDWPVVDRRTLLESLVAQARLEDLWGISWFDTSERRYRDAMAWGFRNLCQPDMADVLEKYLRPQPPDAVPGHILEFVLRALAEIDVVWRDQLHTLVPHVRQLAIEATTQPDVRLAALLAFARIEPSPPTVEATLRDVLELVREGRFADPDDEIAGSLLRLLYLHAIGPDGIWEYAILLHRASSSEMWNFWRYVVCDETPVEELADLLDGFADDAERLRPILASAFAEEVSQKLLVRALREIGDQIDPERLYRWIAAANFQIPTTACDANADMREWLGDNDTIAQQLLRIWITRSIEDASRMNERYLLRELWLATQQLDFVEWCAQQARLQSGIDRDVAHAFVEAPLRYQYWPEDDRGDLIERMRAALANDPQLLDHLNGYLPPSPALLEFQDAERLHQAEINQIMAEHEQKRHQRQSGWREFLRESRNELETNRFSAPNLHTLALAYFGRLKGMVGLEYPRARIAELIGDNAELLDAAMAALRDAPLRDDLPTVERTTDLIADSKHDWLAYPVLAGLAIRESDNSLDETLLSGDIKRKALAIYSGVALMPSDKPVWPERWLQADPTLVLEVLHKCSTAAIKRGDTHLSMLEWLTEVNGLEDALRDFRLGLLRSISVRLPASQMPAVDWLLVLVSKHPDTVPLKELVAQKLQSKSMTGAQRVRWMTLDAIINRGDALGLLDDFVGSNSKRARQLAECLTAGSDQPCKWITRWINDDSCSTLRTLIGILGRQVRPREIKSGVAVSVGLDVIMSDLVNRWTNDLGQKTTKEAGMALDALIADERLRAWHDQFEFARNQQRRLYRDASHAPMDVSAVLGLLRNGPPVNVTDLSVLLCEHLQDIGKHIRGDNADPWRQFWADDQKSPPETPKHEDSCRDALLAMLRRKIPDGVNAQPEGQYAADRRADIRVSYKNFNIPVEIKKNTHAELWSAIHDQLIDKYTTDPETGGYGIYVVLWFGSAAGGYPRHPKYYDRPNTPEELAQRLKESLTNEQHRTIRIVVLDVTKP